MAIILVCIACNLAVLLLFLWGLAGSVASLGDEEEDDE